MPTPLLVAKAADEIFLLPGLANRHGLSAGWSSSNTRVPSSFSPNRRSTSAISCKPTARGVA
jgi:hypothetical protein